MCDWLVPSDDRRPRYELEPPDLADYAAGNTGIPYVWSWDSNRPGPHLLIVGLTHGNELCGAIALDRLLRAGVRPVRGRVSLCFANIAAFQSFDPARPDAARFIDEDLNRVWNEATLFGPRNSTELTRARELLPLIRSADVLLDLHSMHTDTEPLALAGVVPSGLALARRLALPRIIVTDPGHAAGPRLRDYGGFGSADNRRAAVLMECGPHWRRHTAETAFALSLRFLATFDAVTPEWLESFGPLPLPSSAQQVIEVTEVVTVTADRFEFVAAFHGLELILEAGTVIGKDGTREIVTPYDNCILLMPGRRLVRGQTAVRLGRYIA